MYCNPFSPSLLPTGYMLHFSKSQAGPSSFYLPANKMEHLVTQSGEALNMFHTGRYEARQARPTSTQPKWLGGANIRELKASEGIKCNPEIPFPKMEK